MIGMGKRLLPVFAPFLAAGAAASIAAGVYSARIGALRGKSLLLINPSPEFTCSARQGETVLAPFIVKNIQKQPVKLLGATAQCTCTVAQGLPMELLPGESNRITMKVRIGVPDASGNFTAAAQLLTNRDGTVPPLIVECAVLDAPKKP